MARQAFDDSLAGDSIAPLAVQPGGTGGGWKTLLWFAVATAGVGFAGYVFLVPYQKMQLALGSRGTELAAARSTAQEVSDERDKLKEQVGKYAASDEEKAAADSKRKGALDAMAQQLKPALEGLGGTVAAAGGAIEVSFPAVRVIDRNGIDVSPGGTEALTILAGVVKKNGGRARIKARASAAPAPRELRRLFHSAGEMQAVRAARVLSALESAGLAPDHVTIIGQADKTPVPRTRSRKAAPLPLDHLDIAVEPE
jgi:hypothetical protein